MQDERQISLCLTNWNRFDMVIDSFIDVLSDNRISEIIISDDASDTNIYEQLNDFTKSIKKIKLYRNEKNIDCYLNKRQAVSYASNDFVILLDSDNKIGNDYINRIYGFSEWSKNIIYTPSFAKPVFDFRQFSGTLITKETVSELIDRPMFEVCLNACNYFVNRNEYLRVFNDSIDPVTSDSIFFSYTWLKEGNKIYIVNGLEYEHRVHNGHYQTNITRTPLGFHESILQNLRQLA